MKSFLRWAGSKRKVIPMLLEYVPNAFERYVEPFAGSACLFFALKPKKALVSDINEDLINTYKELKTNVDKVIKRLSCYDGNETEYYQVRGQNSNRLSTSRRAARFIYLNRFCFNGLYRANKSGRFNVPYGGYSGANALNEESLRECATALARTTLFSVSFETTLDKIKQGDFVYLDPPYCIQARQVFNSYSHFTFGPTQLILLRRHLVRLDRLGVPFLVSYGVSNEARELAVGFHAREIAVQRQIAGFASNRRKSRELIITNY
ncbi:MAG TPA: Dam family site-specific DNA-(adenine-N6)-methyltransferase [Verrucomicrobiae bacterium]|jgi:DNA adenine methylase|nr:Dam family site-specific DNA-(adenine-N6)-methyltransferase [Verrucomicrobiae bacterium]